MSELIVETAATPVTAPVAETRRWETPFDRVVRGVRALARREPDRDALVAQGAHHVRTGLVAGSVALVGFIAGSFLLSSPWALAAVGVLAGFAVTGAGILASSRIARGVAWLQAATFAVEGVRFFLRLHRDSPFFAGDLVLGTSMLVFAGGVALATLTPAARAWHRVQRAARVRRATSLAAWRALPRGEADA